jgi:hypothetical protein
MICITVSVNYSNILDIILPQNQKFFKKWYIITQDTDLQTINVIKKHNFSNVEIIFFDFYKNATFNKGGAIEYVQKMINDGEKVLLLDSDIFITDDFTKYLDYPLDVGTLYSFTRYDYYTYDNFIKDTHDNIYKINFMGFFQLYIHKNNKHYNNSDSARQCDGDFARTFFGKKVLLDGKIVKHLGRDNVNHFGRKSLDDFIFTPV